jgi:cellulose synthase/poly-beta-1,6-N-acetylglucosamine synthase-like glycosyltransferase
MSIFVDSLGFLRAQSFLSLLHFFWFVLIFDIPRYTVGFFAVATTQQRREPRALSVPGRVSVLLAGYNEEKSLMQCVRSLRAQVGGPFEIVAIDDGSTDGMWDVVARLDREGLIHRCARLHARGGKAAAVNLAARLASGDIFIIVDCDCSFDRHAVARLLAPLADPRVGAVCGNILVRNSDASMITAIQTIEYLTSVTLGRSLLDVLNLVTCVSGAFGAFRREAWEAIGGSPVGPGEDLDITLRLRQRGYEIRFARNAICQTDVPENLVGLVRQRLRWDRDALAIRIRKFGHNLRPWHPEFSLRETAHELDFVIFEFLSAAIFPFYLVYLATFAPKAMLIILLSSYIVLLSMSVSSVLISIYLMQRNELLKLVLFVPMSDLLQCYVMRFVRLYAYCEELIFSRSLKDNYVPEKVRAWSTWR